MILELFYCAFYYKIPKFNHSCLLLILSNKTKLNNFYFIDFENRPNPECYSGKCICPYGYEYDSTNNICEPLSQPGWDHSIKGGSHHQGKFDPSAKLYKCFSIHFKKII